MKLHIKYLFTILLMSIAWVASTNRLQAQTINATNLSSARIDQLSDQQIAQFWQQAQRGGLSESDAVSLLVKRGLPASEVNALKKRLLMMQTRSKSGAQEALLKDTTGFLKDSSWMKEVPAIKKKSQYYGFDFFNNPAISFEPNQRLTTPQSYVIGPDDELAINYTGLNEAAVSATVTANGKILLPYAGPVQVGGLTLEQATGLIKSKMKVAYPAISSGKTQVLVTVTNFKTIRVTVVGEAEIPGTYQVSSLASFFNVLYKANGPSENGSLRKIQLIRNNKPIATIDLYQFLQTGSMQGEVKLQDQDVIHIPVYNKRVSIIGKVKRPMIYELQDKETLQDALQLAGGFESGAVETTAKIIQQAEKEKKIRDIPAADYAYYIPRNGDQVEIGKIASTYSNRVMISGAVLRPGAYELTDQLTVSRLIRLAEGVREDALLQRGYLMRKQAGTGGKMISFHVQDILTGKQPDILLEKEDSITIVSK
ncbi:MAG: capsule biosynthesis protein, partial [Sediminibacterium sp.]|nr:capsule biosynthesis protein [Sediminibacterium sp.]